MKKQTKATSLKNNYFQLNFLPIIQAIKCMLSFPFKLHLTGGEVTHLLFLE